MLRWTQPAPSGCPLPQNRLSLRGAAEVKKSRILSNFMKYPASLGDAPFRIAQTENPGTGREDCQSLSSENHTSEQNSGTDRKLKGQRG